MDVNSARAAPSPNSRRATPSRALARQNAVATRTIAARTAALWPHLAADDIAPT